MANQTVKSGGAERQSWMYGANAVVLVIIGIVVVSLVCYLTNTYTKHIDMTSNGLYSLSAESKAMLKGVEDGKETYKLVSVFRPTAREPYATQRQQVLDLLEEYGRVSGKIKVEDGGDETLADLTKPIQDQYADELQPYKDSIGKLKGLIDDISKFCTMEGANVGAMAQKPGTDVRTITQAAQLQGQFGKGLPGELKQVQSEVDRQMESTTPDWKTLVTTVQGVVDSVQKSFNEFVDLSPDLKAQLTPALQDYFKAAHPRYEAILKKISDYKSDLTKLPDLKVADILNAVGPNTILVMGPKSTKVIPSDDLFQNAASASNPDRKSFTGEQAISSALLAMTHPDKTKVVFVSAAPAQLLQTQYSEISKILTQYNFEPSEWGPAAATPGDPNPPAPTPPPAQGKGVVWVIFPPDAPTEQMMMMGMQPPNPAALVAAVKAHLAAGGRALFLAEASSSNSMMGPAQAYAFAAIVKDYGIAVQDKYTAVYQIDQQDPDTGELKPQTMPIIDIERYPDTLITASMQSMLTRLVPVQAGQGQGYTGFPTVVSKMADAPAGVTDQVILETPPGPQYWGETQFKTDAKYDQGVDLPGPVPMGVTAIKGSGDAETRVAVIGCKAFACDQLLQASQNMLIGSGIVNVQSFPGNSQLFLNTVRWLAGYENMIAVGPKATAAARIRDISPAALTAIDWGILYAGAPLAALVLGGCVWFVRRR